MLDSAIRLLQSLPPWGILVAAFLIPIVEHLFPPAPCDVLLIFLGTLAGLGSVGFVPIDVMALLGSVVGFAIVYGLGRRLGRSVVDSGRLRFLPTKAVARVEKSFARYGYWVIAANRFLSGIRPVVPLFAGISKLPLDRCLASAALSALVWNTVLLYAGRSLGARWREVETYLATYARILVPVVLVLVVLAVVAALGRGENKDDPSA